MELEPYPILDAKRLSAIDAALECGEVDPLGPPDARHTLRLMCDYVADGVFDSEGTSLAWESVPLSCRLHRALLIWNQRWEDLEDAEFDVLFNKVPDPDFDRWFPVARKECTAFGYRLACAVKLELPLWEIDYMDADLSEVMLGPLMGICTYEVTLDMARGVQPRPTEPLCWIKHSQW